MDLRGRDWRQGGLEEAGCRSNEAYSRRIAADRWRVQDPSLCGDTPHLAPARTRGTQGRGVQLGSFTPTMLHRDQHPERVSVQSPSKLFSSLMLKGRETTSILPGVLEPVGAP